MGVLWDKVWFDLWHRKARTLLAVLSIAAGVFAIGTMFGLADQMLAGMNEAHRAVDPSHLNLVLRQFIDRETAEALTDIPGVVGVEPLNIATIRYKTSPDGAWQPATAVARADYENQSYDRLELKAGAWPDGRRVAVERITSDYYGVGMGDEIIFEVDGVDRPFTVAGLIRHPFVPPPDFGGNAYFFFDEATMARFGFPEGRYVQLLIQVEPYSEAYARDRAAAIKERLAQQGLGVNLILYQEPEKHWGYDTVLGITVVLQILAVVSLLTSVIIVINVTTAIITQQTDQIGVIKALGGTSRDVARVYLAGVLIFGALALLVALPAGMLMAFLTTKQLLTLFNIDYDVFRFSTRAVVWQVLAALLAPLLAALLPVMRGAAISVREALASYGLGGDFGSSRLDQTVERLAERLLPSPYTIALGNMFRRKGRLLLTQLVLTLAGAMFLMVLTLSASMTNTLDTELDRRQYDMRLFFFQAHRSDRMEALLERYPGVVEAEAWYSVNGVVLRQGEEMEDTGGLGAELFGVPSGSTMYQPLITAGRWLSPEDQGRVAVISRDTAEFNDLSVGDVITVNLADLGQADFEVIGTYQAISPDVFSTDPVYAPAAAVVDVTKRANRANQVLIRAEARDATSLQALMADLDEYLTAYNMEVSPFFSRTKPQDREYAFNTFGIVNQMLFSVALVMGLVGGIGLMGSLSISVVERTREVGVLRSIGGTSPVIMTMFILEGVLQGLMSWLVAVPLSYVIARPMASLLGRTIFQTELDFAYSYTAVGIWLVAVLSIAFLASIIPAHAAGRISVRESLAYA
ncbi:ABC transporter permease [Promineifilum sp.]|uniref:ABC transporter permease n=1 Tax=Promineifilum sp. TaxID=2664178 RepID=UPI0035B0B00B